MTTRTGTTHDEVVPVRASHPGHGHGDPMAVDTTHVDPPRGTGRP